MRKNVMVGPVHASSLKGAVDRLVSFTLPLRDNYYSLFETSDVQANAAVFANYSNPRQLLCGARKLAMRWIFTSVPHV